MGVELWDIADKQIVPMALKNLAGKPFPDMRVQSWQLLAALVRSRNAAQQIIPATEMRDLLLDFTSETNSDARIAKHGFVVALQTHNSTWLSAYLDESIDAILGEYAKQGPHWVPRATAAAVGEDTG